LTTKSEKIVAWRPTTDRVPTIETKPLLAPSLRIASAAKFEAAPTRLTWIVSGVMVVFGLLIAGDYWARGRGRAPVTAQVARPIDTTAKPQAVSEPPPMHRPVPQLSVGLWAVSSRPGPAEATAPIAASPVFAPRQQELRYITIAEGQSLSRIARATHLPARTIAAANHLEPPYRLKAGSQLLLPDPGLASDQDAQPPSATSPLYRRS